MGYLIALGVIAALWLAGTLHGTGDSSQKSAAPPPAVATAQPSMPASAAPRDTADRAR